VQRVVLIERAVPHGGPQVIRLQPKQQFKDSLIKQMIEAAVFFVDPIRERWGLIIEENPAILYGGFTFDVSSRLDVQRIVMRDRNIRPTIPGRHANLFRDVIDSEDRAALVAAGNNESAGDPWQWMRNHLDQVRFPFAANGLHIDFLLLDELVDDGAAADGSDQNHIGWK